MTAAVRLHEQQPEAPPPATTAGKRVSPKGQAGAMLTAPVQQLLLTSKEAAKACGVSYPTWARMKSAGKTPAPVAIGRSLYSATELAAWCAAGCPPRAEWGPRWKMLQANGGR